MIQLIKYTGASAIALLVDYGCYLIMLSLSLSSPEVLATTSYLLGLGVAYVLMKRLVFNFKNQFSLQSERIRFLMSGLLGSLTTYCTTKVAMWAYPYPEVAKLVAVGVSFFVVYFYRNKYVFKKNNY